MTWAINSGISPSCENCWKIYEGFPDPTTKRHDQIRIIDESGEDYIYPAHCFVAITLPHTVQQALKLAA